LGALNYRSEIQPNGQPEIRIQFEKTLSGLQLKIGVFSMSLDFFFSVSLALSWPRVTQGKNG
jgi:hypothetical protein